MQWIKASERKPDDIQRGYFIRFVTNDSNNGCKAVGQFFYDRGELALMYNSFTSGTWHDLSEIEWLDETESAPSSDQLREAAKESVEVLGTVNFSSHNQMREAIEGSMELLETALALPASPGSGWVRVDSGKMPEENEYIMVIIPRKGGGYFIPFVTQYNGAGKWRNPEDTIDTNDYSHSITHWMPLPSPPKE